MVIGVSAMPLAKRYVALAILGVTQGLSAAMGPVIGGIITQNFGWRWCSSLMFQFVFLESFYAALCYK